MRTKISDKVLIKEYLAGSNKALEQLITKHKDKIFTSILIFTKDKYLAEDLFQDTFIKVIDKLKAGKYREEGKFLPWVMRISHNMCIDYYRKSKRKPTVSASEDFNILDILPLNQESPEETIIDKQANTKVRALLNELSEEQREVVLLRHYYDFSFKEIAELTGVSINTALGRMRYSLINLRKVIEDKKIQLK